MLEHLNTLVEEAKSSIHSANDLQSVEHLRVKYLGKKGHLTELMKEVTSAPVEQRPALGKEINVAKRDIQEWLNTQISVLQQKALDEKLSKETIDITLPGRGQSQGSRHPVARVRERCVELFKTLGFVVKEGPEIEDELHNFEALNIPSHHPARSSVDTFYFGDGRLLRTHTSSVQIRVMSQEKPPFRMITPGRVYRRDSDPTHTPMFHQLEALVVSKTATFAELKGLLQDFFMRFFEKELRVRFRPSYFPFTEPSAEVDIEHIACSGKGCRICKNSGFIEVMGCGMVNPNVLRNMNIDPDEYIGYAFGLGLDRMAMLRYNIDDLRSLFENDLRFLEQF